METLYLYVVGGAPSACGRDEGTERGEEGEGRKGRQAEREEEEGEEKREKEEWKIRGANAWHTHPSIQDVATKAQS